MNRSIAGRLPGFRLVEVLVVAGVLVILIGLLIPANQKNREAAARVRSQNNLKLIGITLNNYAAYNNNELPRVDLHNAPFFFVGQTGGTETKAGTPSVAPGFPNGLLGMCFSTETLVAPLDMNVGNAKVVGEACSYSIPAYWSTVHASGILTLPDSFKRGTSQCLAAAEMTSQGVTFRAIVPFATKPYTPGLPNTASTTANSFSTAGCQIVFVDCSVRNVSHAANRSGDFILAQEPDNTTTPFTSAW